MKQRLSLAIALLLSLGTSGPYEPQPSSATIAARAFVITDPDILAAFPFEDVVRAVSPAGATWMDVLAPAHSAARPVVMPFTRFTPASRDGLWTPAAANEWSYMRPIAIVNRFDLASPEYRNCGEYRLIFSRRTANGARLNVAVEMVLPNPEPAKRVAGCRRVAELWWQLAHTTSAEARRAQLQTFFFRGLPSFTPVLDPKHFERSGRVRTSEISDGRPKFAQFEMRRRCASCVAQLTRVTLDNMPHGSLFDGDAAGPRAAAFRRDFLRQIASLSIADVNRYSMSVDPAFTVRDVETLVPPFNYRLPFRRSQRTAAGRTFREEIAAELRRLGSALTPEDVIDRAETQNCAGCHGKPGPVGGGLVFPKAFEQGEHIADMSVRERARLSPALEEVFIPYRIAVLQQSLNLGEGR